MTPYGSEEECPHYEVGEDTGPTEDIGNYDVWIEGTLHGTTARA